MRTKIKVANIDGKIVVLSSSKTFWGTKQGVRCASSSNTCNKMTQRRREDLERKAAIVRARKEKEARRAAHSIEFEKKLWAAKFAN